MAKALSPRAKKLRAHQRELVRDLTEVDREIRELEKSLGRPGTHSRRRPHPAAIVRRPNARRLNDVTVRQAIRDLLREKKKPMHYREIAETLIREDRYRSKSKHFLSTVAITIMRGPEFKRVESGVYTLKAGR